MDKERAKFILQSFRPDGGDADEPVFAEALGLAAQDRELGEWLAEERAQDAAFATMLSEIEIPEDLREAVFQVLEGAQDRPAEFDGDFVGALAAVKPPQELRDQILGAMEVEQKVVEMPERHRRGYFKAAMWTTSVAAVVAVVIGVGAFFAGAGGNALAGTTTTELHHAAIDMLEDPFLSLDLQNDRQAVLEDWLDERDLPVPADLPEGLKGVRGLGCKYLEIGEDKSRGSLICYLKGEWKVHLVMVERSTVGDEALRELKGALEACHNCPINAGWSMTQWADDQYAYLLLSKVDSGQLAELF